MDYDYEQQQDEERRRQEEEPVRHGYLSPIYGCTHRGERDNVLTGDDARWLFCCIGCWQREKRKNEAERKLREAEHARRYPHYADAYDKRPQWERDAATGARDPATSGGRYRQTRGG